MSGKSHLNDTWRRFQALRVEAERLCSDESDPAAWRAWLQESGALIDAAARRDGAREAMLRELTLVLSCTAAERVWQVALEALVRLTAAERGYLLLARSDEAHDVVASHNPDSRPESAEISRRVVEEVMGSGRALRLDDALNTAPYSSAESVSRLKLLSVLCVPVLSEEKTIGAVYLENRRASGVFSEDSETLAVDFAERIGCALMNADAMQALRAERDRLQDNLSQQYAFEGVVGTSAAFRVSLRTAMVAARSDITVLIEGESGTGKDLLARSIHERSDRRSGPFVSVNCAALPRHLLESELFGHTRGAFTGTTRERKGLFASAHGGTLFLDEIGEMPLDLQSKLLRVLQSGEYRPVGSDDVRRTDARIVAATLLNLHEQVRGGTFREDLYFRLKGLTIRIPPLRERKEDIPLLIDRFLERYAQDRVIAIDGEAMACLTAYDYPGNVRELESIIRRALLFAEEGRIGVAALPEEVAVVRGPVLRLSARVPRTAAELLKAKEKAKRQAVARIERAFLERALAETGVRPGEAARLTGMNRSQFARMLSKHGMGKKRK